MSVVKTGNRTFQHNFYRINPRSKVNMYVSKDVAEAKNGVAQRVAQATVEESLLKSRLVTNRWLEQVSKKKRDLEEKMFMMEETSMLPYSSQYSINQGYTGGRRSNMKARSSDRMASTQSVWKKSQPNFGGN